MTLERSMLEVPGPRGTTIAIEVYAGGEGPDLLFQHGAGGLLADDPFLARLAERFRVHAPLLPGYGESASGEELRSMLDFTLHAFDVAKALGLDHPLVVGHSMGGMIAAEMAAIAPRAIDRLALIAPAGIWLDDCPVEDLFTKLPFELPELLLHDPAKHGHLLSAGGNFDDPEFLTGFLVGNARRLGTAGKLLFPVPDRGLRDRLYRITARTQIVWGASDRMIDPRYGRVFAAEIADASLDVIDAAGHMVPYEQTDAVLESIGKLHN